MADLRKVLDGLTVLASYDTEGANVDAQHDQLFAGGPNPTIMKPGDADKMSAAGWRWSDDYECWARFT